MRRWILAALLAAASMAAPAADREERAALRSEFEGALGRGDFAALDARYASALAKKERTSSGIFVSNRLIAQVLEGGQKTGGAAKGNDAYWTPIEELSRKWLQQNPRSLFGSMVLTEAYIGHAWAWRGGGYSGTVSKEDWRKFNEYLVRAQETLAAQAQAGQADPNWHWQMLRLGRFTGWTQEKYFGFAESAVQRFPGHYDLYFEVAQRLMPQWGGSFAALSSFADHAVDLTKSFEGPSMYGRIYWVVHGSLGPRMFESDEVKWPKIRSGFDEVVKRYPDPRNLNFFARMACDAGDKPTTKRILDRVGDRLITDAWVDRSNWMRCKSWAEGKAP